MMMYMKFVYKNSGKKSNSPKLSSTTLKHSICVNVDEFNSKKVGPSGFVTKIHPKLVNIPALKYRIQEALRNTMCDRVKVVEEWKNLYRDTEEDGNTIPNFFSWCRITAGDSHPKE
eukprot:10635-Ditylum_brightwellii.AAC.1